MPVCVGVGAAVALPDSDLLPVLDALAPAEREAVGEALCDEDEESVDDGVGKGEGVPLAVGEQVPVGVAL